jgi:hypothetical protein
MQIDKADLTTNFIVYDQKLIVASDAYLADPAHR